MRVRAIAFAALFGLLTTAASAQEDERRWGLTLWGLSFHPESTIDYDEQNWGAGIRRYFGAHLFIEGDALRNSNRGIVLAASLGVELGLATIRGCHVEAVGTLTAAYYQNPRTHVDDFKIGPVPGMALRCGRIEPTALAVFGRSRGLVAVVAALTIHF